MSVSEKRRERQRRNSATYRARNPEQRRKTDRKAWSRQAGWAPGEFERAEIALAAVTQCYACGSTNPGTKRNWHRDHDHRTGLFRGILCTRCNIALGFLEANNDHLYAYLRRFS